MLQGAPMATDIFAKLGDIKGESADAKHKDEIEVLSFSWGVANSGSSGSGSGSGAGKATFQDLLIAHVASRHSAITWLKTTRSSSGCATARPPSRESTGRRLRRRRVIWGQRWCSLTGN